MFVYSVKGNTLKFLGIICLAAVLTVSLLVLVPRNGAEAVSKKETEVSFDRIKTNKDRLGFLGQFGWKAEEKPIKEAKVRIPKNFDTIMNSYNEIQIHQGLDLTKFTGKEVTRYSYRITNYPNYSGEVTANIIVYKDSVIGADICSADVDGFIHELTVHGGGTPLPSETENNGGDETVKSADTAGEAETSPAPSPEAAPENEA